MQLLGLRFQIDYGNFLYENYYPAENTLVWKSLKGKSMTGFDEGFEVTETVTTLAVGEQQFLVSWVEKSGLGVTQYLDFTKGVIHSVIRKDKELFTEQGKLTLVQ